MKILIIGNCQARPVSTFISALCPEATILPEIIVHLETDENAEKNNKAMHSADVIFSQLVQDGYPVSHLITDTIKSNHANKVVAWPNAFFTGQSPNVVCLSKPGMPRVKGPLDVYHVVEILSAWQEGKPIAECIESIIHPASTSSVVSARCDHSLAELKQRESSCDVIISDYIESNWLETKLFHVFNHPTNRLLIELSLRLCNAANLQVTTAVLAEFWPEALNRVIPPTLPSIKSTLGFEFDCSTSCKGFNLVVAENGVVELGSTSILSIKKLVELFYDAYDSQLSKDDVFTYTPRFLDSDLEPSVAA